MEVQKNVRWFDRGARFVFGVILLAWAIAGGPWWAYVGLVPLATAAFGYCPLYWLLRINARD